MEVCGDRAKQKRLAGAKARPDDPDPVVLLAASLLAGCSIALETDQARLCRMALPALTPVGATIDIVGQSPDPDGRGLAVAFTAATPGEEPERHLAACRFREPGRPRESRDLIAVTLDGEAIDEGRLFALIRYWLATPQGRNADPAPLAGLRSAPVVSKSAAYALQMAIDGLPLAAVYALLAAAYSLVYGLIGRINFAFGELAAAGGYGAAMTALALAGLPRPRCSRRPSAWRGRWRSAGDTRARAQCSFR